MPSGVLGIILGTSKPSSMQARPSIQTPSVDVDARSMVPSLLQSSKVDSQVFGVGPKHWVLWAQMPLSPTDPCSVAGRPHQ